MQKIPNNEIVLVFPPAFYPHMPYLALPSLIASLRSHGMRCRQLDLNIELYEYVTQRDQVASAWRKLTALAGMRGNSPEIDKRLHLTAHQSLATLADLVPGAKSAIRGRAQMQDYAIDPWRVVTLALDVVSDAHFPELISVSKYQTLGDPSSSISILESLEMRHASLYHEFCCDRLRSLLLETDDTSVVAFSITVPDQLIPVAGLSASIREEFPRRKILWGGSLVTRLGQFFGKPNVLSHLYDGIVLGEGEDSIHVALECLDSMSEFPTAGGSPSVFRKDPDREALNTFQVPDFEDLPLDLYFAPRLTLPLLASRHCYWGKCIFCDIPASYAPTSRMRSASRVVDDMETLREFYDCRFIKFTDDALSPKQMKEISEEILRRGIDVRWEAYVRLESEFTDISFCQLLYRAGCRWLYFGLETGSSTTAAKMRKGNSAGLSSRIIQTVSDAGIRVHIWVIVGFPTETRGDVWESVEFVIKHGSWIDSIEVNQFALTRLAPIMSPDLLDSLGVTPIIPPERDLALLYDYEVSSGLAQCEASALTMKVRRILARELGIPDVVRSSHLSYCGEPGMLDSIPRRSQNDTRIAPLVENRAGKRSKEFWHV